MTCRNGLKLGTIPPCERRLSKAVRPQPGDELKNLKKLLISDVPHLNGFGRGETSGLWVFLFAAFTTEQHWERDAEL